MNYDEFAKQHQILKERREALSMDDPKVLLELIKAVRALEATVQANADPTHREQMLRELSELVDLEESLLPRSFA